MAADVGDVDTDFITSYMSYIGDTESPMLYHRWCGMALLAGMLGRDCFFKFGHFNVHANMYLMLIGLPATRKSTAIKIAKKLAMASGYSTIAADKTTKEKWLMDLAAQHDSTTGEAGDILDKNLFGEEEDDASILSKPPIECFIMADEFNDFLGNGNIEFISMLGVLYDYEGIYRNRIKTGKSVNLPNPTINILSGNTPTNFSLAFPPEIIGQGFFSRLILVYGEPTGKRITFPVEPSPAAISEMVTKIAEIKRTCSGEILADSKTRELLDKIYKTYKGIDDVRFDHYTGRRFTHLIKLCIICAVSRGSRNITEKDVLLANTVLTHTEHLMPKALGEFGKSKHSDTINKIMDVLNRATAPMTANEIYKIISTDLDKFSDIGNLMNILTLSDKVMFVKSPAPGGFLPKKTISVEVASSRNSAVVDFSLLTEAERNGV